MNNIAEAPTELLHRLRQLVEANTRRWKAIILLEALGLAIAAPLGYLWLVFLVDNQLHLPAYGRVLASLGRAIRRKPLRRKTVLFLSPAYAPRLSWAMAPPTGGVFQTQPQLQWYSKIGVLMRFPFVDIIPKGQRVTKAELTLTASYVAGGEPKLTVRRVLAEWGAGVCHQYRVAYPAKIEWTQPGGRGASTDRAAKDSAVFKFAKVGPQTVDLTEDVELWYTGAVANRGWIFTMETAGEHIYLPSPYAPHANGGKEWKLQLTFEPK